MWKLWQIELGSATRGRLRYVGNIVGMLNEVRGKVWELIATAGRNYRRFVQKYLETGLTRDGDRLRIRVAAESVDHPNSRPLEPNLEDAYIWLMRENGENKQSGESSEMSNGGS